MPRPNERREFGDRSGTYLSGPSNCAGSQLVAPIQHVSKSPASSDVPSISTSSVAMREFRWTDERLKIQNKGVLFSIFCLVAGYGSDGQSPPVIEEV